MRYSRLRFLCLIVVAASLGFAKGAFSQSSSTVGNVPKVTQFVTDEAGVLNQNQIQAIESRLVAYQDSTSNQIVVLIVKSVPEGDLFDYSMSVASKNKIGQKGKDNGLLFTVDVGDHKARFEVGYGLEGVVTDAYSEYILTNIVIPEFKKGDYYAGIDKGITALASLIGGTFHADLKKQQRGSPIGSFLPLIIFVFIFIFPMLFNSRRYSASGRGSGSSWWFFPLFFGGFGGGGGFGGFSGGGGSFGGGGASGSW